MLMIEPGENPDGVVRMVVVTNVVVVVIGLAVVSVTSTGAMVGAGTFVPLL